MSHLNIRPSDTALFSFLIVIPVDLFFLTSLWMNRTNTTQSHRWLFKIEILKSKLNYNALHEKRDHLELQFTGVSVAF